MKKNKIKIKIIGKVVFHGNFENSHFSPKICQTGQTLICPKYSLRNYFHHITPNIAFKLYLTVFEKDRL